MTELERIESKLDKILALLGMGCARTTAELRRKATDDISRLTSQNSKRIRNHVRAIEKRDKAPD